MYPCFRPQSRGLANSLLDKREKDFTESANNFNISGVGARHPLAKSFNAVQIAGAPYWEITMSPTKVITILPMTINDAKIFIDNLIKKWMEAKR